jgi:site-specific DNA recombinase
MGWRQVVGACCEYATLRRNGIAHPLNLTVPSRLQNRIEAMYVDKLDGRVDTVFFDRKAAEWRTEQSRLMRAIENHQAADQTYLEEGIRLLDFVLSNCTWKGGALQATFRQPFDLLIGSTKACGHKKAAGVSSNGSFENWRG